MLDLEKEIPKPARLSFWPFVDICAIGLMFAVFGSKFIMTPGITLALPEVENSQVAIAPVYEVVTVTEVKGEEMVFYQDSVLDLESFAKLLAERGYLPKDATLLVKADARVSMQTLSSLSELAIEAGYARVQLATEDRNANRESFFSR